ncbi:MAG TPA: RHS repeat-associated core domain-containing protein, partial [Herpetosiphonaceae bacterium]
NPIEQKKTSYDWTYSYDGAQPHAPTHIGDRTFRYDANGNQAGWDHDQNGTRRNIVWDEENRIQSIFDNGHEKTYAYNDAGERVIKRGPQGETAYINQYFTMRNREVGTKHVYVGETRIVSKLLKQDKPGANPNGQVPLEKDQYFYHADHLGSTGYVTDANGDLYQHIEYFPFGETWVEEASNTQRTPYLFTAKELDEETGLYYYGARYYDPRTSVWQSTDPILEKYLPSGKDKSNLAGKGGVYNSFNLGLYSYSYQNPVRYTDPDGNSPWDIVDVGFWLWSAKDFYDNPSWSNAGWLVLDTASLLPIVPSSGWARRGAQALSHGSHALALRRLRGPAGLWNLPPFQRGNEIEALLGRGRYLAHVDNFPVIDRFENGIATSIKSLNLGDRTYQNASNLRRRVTQYIDQMANYQGQATAFRGLTIDNNDIRTRALELVIPARMTRQQAQTLADLSQYARRVNVDFKVYVLP